MNLNLLFTTKGNCFLPIGNKDALYSVMNRDLRVFWDGSWTFEGRSTRALVFFCDKYTRGYKPRKSFSSILPPNLFMFSAGNDKELVCDLLLYPEDILFQDHRTTAKCIGMLPLSLRKKRTGDRIDAQLLEISLFDYRIQQNFFVLLWLHPTPIVFQIVKEYKQNIAYYWEHNSYLYRHERTYSLSLFEQHNIVPEYYISSRGLTKFPRVTSFFSDMMYRYKQNSIPFD